MERSVKKAQHLRLIWNISKAIDLAKVLCLSNALEILRLNWIEFFFFFFFSKSISIVWPSENISLRPLSTPENEPRSGTVRYGSESFSLLINECIWKWSRVVKTCQFIWFVLEWILTDRTVRFGKPYRTVVHFPEWTMSFRKVSSFRKMLFSRKIIFSSIDIIFSEFSFTL